MKKLPGQGTRHSAFTFIELIIVLAIIGALFILVGFQTGTFTYWREEGFIRKLSETIQFLHTQAITDQAMYQMRIDIEKNQYEIGVLREESSTDEFLAPYVENLGNLSLELISMQNQTITDSMTFIPPPSYPSLADPQRPPPGMIFSEVKTNRDVSNNETKVVEINFSPRGFSDFAVIHLTQYSGAPVTLLVNPFTGLVSIYREDKDFEWSYGKEKK